MKKTKIALLVSLVLAAITLLAASILLILRMPGKPDSLEADAPSYDIQTDLLPSDILAEAIPEPVPVEKTIRLLAVGDNLIHGGVHSTGKISEGVYDFSFLFENIQPYLDDADIKIINQETIFGGNHLGNDGQLGYPRFNSRTEIGDAIANAGFNVVLHSSNHTVDQGLDGLLHCMSYWKENHPDVLICGVRDVPEETPTIPTMEIEGVTFAFLNYTYGPNAESFPSKYEGYMDMLCYYDPSNRRIDFTTLNPKVIDDIKRAEEIADIVVVCPHWGSEYQIKQSKYQEQFALQMTEAGADIIIGTHPHVVQPVTYIESENGNKSLCYYSLGNYVSTQKQVNCMLEGMAVVTFTVTTTGDVTEIAINEEETGVIPLVCQYTQGRVRIDNIYFLADYTEELALKHGIYTYGGVAIHLEDMTSLSEKVFGDWAMEPYLDTTSSTEEPIEPSTETNTADN